MSLNVGGGHSPIRFQDVTTQPAVEPATIQQPSAPTPGAVGPSAYVPAGQNPFAPGTAGGSAVAPGAQAVAERLFNQLQSSGPAQQAFSTYPHQARNEALQGQITGIADQLVKLATGNPPATAEQLNAFTNQATGNLVAALDRQFGALPANPNAPQPPANAYDWNSRNTAMKELTGPLSKQLVDMAQRGVPQGEIDRFAETEGAKIDAQINAKFGPAPEIRSPNQPPAGYPLQQRNSEQQAALGSLSDRISQMVSSGASPAEVMRFATGEGKKIDDALNAKYGPLTPAPYEPAKDTKEGYDQHISHAQNQYDSMLAGGASQAQLQGYAQTREAQVNQLFPKQAMRASAEREWTAVASKMQANGSSPDQVKEYLTRKASEYKEPTREELQVFVEKRANDEQQLQVLAQQMQKPQQTQPGEEKKKFDFWGGMTDKKFDYWSGSDEQDPSKSMSDIIKSFGS